MSVFIIHVYIYHTYLYDDDDDDSVVETNISVYHFSICEIVLRLWLVWLKCRAWRRYKFVRVELFGAKKNNLQVFGYWV